MRIVAIVQARMGSTRLPGKVLRKLGDYTVLAHVINRLKGSKYIQQVIIATTQKNQDDVIEEEAIRNHVQCYRGSEEDVLSRYYEAAVQYRADVVVRVTSDCPFIDPVLVDRVIEKYLERDSEYARLDLNTYPRGFDCEVISFRALEEIYSTVTESQFREHVTLYAYQHPELYKSISYAADEDNSKYRLTLDTVEDWHVISEVYKNLSVSEQMFGVVDVVSFCKKHPEISEYNLNIEQQHNTK